jgi:rhamnosyltransferase subunit B
MEAEYRLLLDRLGDGPSVIVVRHMGSLAAWFAAEAARVPLVSMFTAVAQANCWPLFEQLCAVHLREELDHDRRTLGLPAMASWRDWFALPSLCLGSWPSWFADRLPTWPGDILALGFLRSDETECDPLPDDLARWIDAGPPPVLITGGTARWALSPQFYQAAARGCVLAGYRAIVVCPHDDVDLGGAMDGVVRYRFLPFGTLAARVAAIIHHGGTSVLVRAMVSDLPQLALPYGADRPDTAQRLAKTGAAIWLPPSQWQPELVAASLARLLASGEVRQACRRAGALVRAGATGLEPACDAIEALITRPASRTSVAPEPSLAPAGTRVD